MRCAGERAEDNRLGDGYELDRSTPVYVKEILTAVDIHAGDTHSCVLLQGGAVRCWGDGSQGQAGDGSTGSQLRDPPVAALGSEYSITFRWRCQVYLRGIIG